MLYGLVASKREVFGTASIVFVLATATATATVGGVGLKEESVHSSSESNSGISCFTR